MYNYKSGNGVALTTYHFDYINPICEGSKTYWYSAGRKNVFTLILLTQINRAHCLSRNA